MSYLVLPCFVFSCRVNHSIIVVGNRPCFTTLHTMTRSSYPEGCQQCSPWVHGVARICSAVPNAGITTTITVSTQESSSETSVRNIPRKSESGKKMLQELQEDAQEKMRLRRDKRAQELRVEKEREKRQSLVKCQKEERERIKQRTEKRLAELRVEYLRNEEEQDTLFPS